MIPTLTSIGFARDYPAGPVNFNVEATFGTLATWVYLPAGGSFKYLTPSPDRQYVTLGFNTPLPAGWCARILMSEVVESDGGIVFGDWIGPIAAS